MQTSRNTLTALGVVGAVLVVNAAVLGPMIMFDSRPFSEIGGLPQHRVFNVVLLLCVGALAVLLPRLAQVPGRTGRAVPATVALAAGFGAYLDGGTRFVEAFVVPFLADKAPALLDETLGGVLMYAMVTAWILWSLALIALGVTAYRARVFPRAAAVLLVLGALVIPAIGPIAGVLVGGAFVWSALSARRAGQFSDLLVPSPTTAG